MDAEARTIVIVRMAGPFPVTGASTERIAEQLEPTDELWVTAQVPPRLTLVPFRRSAVSLVSLGGTDAVRERTLERLRAGGDRLEAWDVETTTPVVATKVPPGAVLLTLFRKRRGLDPATFRRRWFDEHTPLTLRIHPVTGYVRHAVQRRRVGAVDWDGIVTEDFAELAHLTSIGLFGQGLFGRGPGAALNAVRVGRHIGTFLDLSTIETYLVQRAPVGHATPRR